MNDREFLDGMWEKARMIKAIEDENVRARQRNRAQRRGLFLLAIASIAFLLLAGGLLWWLLPQVRPDATFVFSLCLGLLLIAALVDARLFSSPNPTERN